MRKMLKRAQVSVYVFIIKQFAECALRKCVFLWGFGTKHSHIMFKLFLFQL